MNEVAKHYDLLIKNGNDPVLDSPALSQYMDKWDGQKFIKLLNVDKNKNILEIGCGTGRIAKKIIDYCKTYVGIDVSRKTIQVAKKHFNCNSNAIFICGNFIDYHFKETYDVIYSTLTFMHIQNKKAALGKIFELLKHNGMFVLSIDKNQQNFIDTGYSKITVFPDTPKEICEILASYKFNNITVNEIEFAYIISAIRI